MGPGFFDLSALNNRLAANGYQRIDGMLPIIGGEGHAVFASGFVGGGRGAAILGGSGDGPGNQRTHFGGGFGMADFGLALVRSPQLLFTLTAGIGGYGLGLDINDEQSAKFDDVLKAPARSITLSRGGLLVGLTLGIDGRVPIGRAERGRRGFFTLGARLGALYGLPTGGWSLPEGTRASAGPTGALTGAYAAQAVSFGGGVEARHSERAQSVEHWSSVVAKLSSPAPARRSLRVGPCGAACVTDR